MVVTGECTSRLSELRKYKVTGTFFEKYKTSTGSAVDGIDVSKSDITSNPQSIVYYLGGITYVDVIDDVEHTIRTTLSFQSQGYDSSDFINLPIIKDPNKNNLVQHPKIDTDVFIVRQELSVFDLNFKLREITNLIELTSYAGGKFFNIVTNT